MSAADRRGAPRICVVGAGIAGLAAAWEVRQSAPEADLIVLDSASRPGGVIRTSPFAGRAVDEGADAFLARVDDGTRLCAELGLSGDLVAPTTGRAFVHLDGALTPLPRSHFLGVPLDPDDISRGLLSPAAMAVLRADLDRGSAFADPVTPAQQPDGGGADPEADRSIGALIRGRLGDEVLERLVGPLVGSINAGDCDRLSLRAAAPALADAARSDPSLIRALRRRAGEGDSPGTSAEPVFRGLRGGMERLTAALAERLGPALVLSEGATACRVRNGRDGRPAICGVQTPERSIDCDAVILAVGAAPAATLVEQWAPGAATLLARTQTASVAIVTLAYRAAAVPGVGTGSGFLVPAAAGLHITACSWASTKWAHLGKGNGGGRSDSIILRVSLGRHGDDGIVRRPDWALVEAARAGLAATMGLTATPAEVRVSRWPNAFPQYAVGHLQRTAAVEETLGAAGAFCAGSSYHGIGIPACIGSGRRAARAAVARARRNPQP